MARNRFIRYIRVPVKKQTAAQRMEARASSLPRLRISRWRNGSRRKPSVRAGDHEQTITTLGDRKLSRNNGNMGRTIPVRLVKKAFERIAAQGGIPIVGRWAALYMTSVLEYMISEVLELAGDAALKTKKARQTRPKIDTVHMIAAMKGDEELKAWTKGAIVIGACSASVFAAKK